MPPWLFVSLSFLPAQIFLPLLEPQTAMGVFPPQEDIVSELFNVLGQEHSKFTAF